MCLIIADIFSPKNIYFRVPIHFPLFFSSNPVSSWHRNTYPCPTRKRVSLSVHLTAQIFGVNNSQTNRPNTETHFRVRHGNTFPCPSFWLHRFFECITHRLHVPTRKHISVHNSQTTHPNTEHFRVRHGNVFPCSSFWLHRVFECKTHWWLFPSCCIMSWWFLTVQCKRTSLSIIKMPWRWPNIFNFMWLENISSWIKWQFYFMFWKCLK